jgi:quercetin dioxygenase-like cupin family protein
MLISPGLEEWGTRGKTVKTRVFGLSFPHKEETMNKTIASHAVFGCATAVLASFATWLYAQAPANAPARQTELFKTTMSDVLGREVTIRRLERDPGTGSGPHRHPGSHTFGYVLEGTYEVKVGDGPLQKLGPGGVFYEAPGALHAVSRNGSSTQGVKYLVIQVSDPTKPAIVPE